MRPGKSIPRFFSQRLLKHLTCCTYVRRIYISRHFRILHNNIGPASDQSESVAAQN